MAINDQERTIVVVGLNRTLLATDVLWELALQSVRTKPLAFLVLPVLLLGGPRRLCEWLVRNHIVDPDLLPYRKDVLQFLKEQKAQGRSVILATRAPLIIARIIADHLGFVDQIVASDGPQPISVKNKLEMIQSLVQDRLFEFVGHNVEDFPVMEQAARVTLVHPRKKLMERVKRLPKTPLQVLGSQQRPSIGALKALRLHHWVKNLLLAVPLIMAHQWHDLQSLWKLLAAIFSFSLATSAVYVCNDLLDLQADRLHPIKRKRALASGVLPLPTAFLIAVLLAFGGILFGYLLSPVRFVWFLITYTAVAIAYSASFKRCIVLDVIVLAGLYALRILAGGAVVNVPVSAWLLAFSGFFFLSLAFAKRYLELSLVEKSRTDVTAGSRPYSVADLDIFRIAGPTCGLLSVLVLALYINSPGVQTLYQKPYLLWFLCPLFLYWILRTWVLVLRGQTDSDPVVFALQDKVSLVVGLLILATLFLAV